ncbi:MAG TPA: histidinol dehydrogenase, partial [Solirubrobacteraceae bacterium]|nr:histidinol dehydrogenase [Solirubrobacteraceae bacterium]
MRCERFRLSGDPAELVRQLRALVPGAESVSAEVAQIIGLVRRDGDAAVVAYSRSFDTSGAEPRPLRVGEEELDNAAERLDPDVRRGLERAIANVEAVAVARAHREQTSVELGTHVVRLRRVPVARAGVYVPGGRAPYPSTVVMGVVPARVAGVPDIAVCAPPGADGDINPVILGACRLAGASSVYRMGGAQAIAALAYGTETVPPVDVIVGPGNLYVQEAKRQVFGQVGIDGFAGPSDLLLIADGDVDPEPLALDLLAQAEHGPGTLVIAASPDASLLDALGASVDGGADTGAAAAIVSVEGPEEALALAEEFAPEHLQLAGSSAEALASRVSRAGCVFVGEASGTAFGDYIAGSNHILPTGGAARFASALSPEHFLRGVTEVRIEDGS